MTSEPKPMTALEYQRIRKRLKVSNYRLRRILGISIRQAQRYESDEAEVPPTTRKLLRILDGYAIALEDVAKL